MHGYKTPHGGPKKKTETTTPAPDAAGPDNSLMQDRLAQGGGPGQEPGLLEQLINGTVDALSSGWAALTDDTPLRLGDEGVRVVALQKALARIGWEIEADGIYGKQTAEIVTAFQLQAGLEPDGIAGPDTWAALSGERTVDETWADDKEAARDAQRERFGDLADPTTGGAFDIPLRDVIYEQLAHRAAYLQFPATFQLHNPEDHRAFDAPRKDAFDGTIPAWTDKEDVQQLIAGLGYRPEVVHDDRLTGFQVVLFVPTADGVRIEDHPHFKRLVQAIPGGGPGLRPVVAFRGSQDQKSWADDYNPEGIGAYQFRMNEAEVLTLLAQGTTEVGPPDVVGHSLGGALAQLAAARHGNRVNEVVTFQAGAVNLEEAQAVGERGVESTHYRYKGDMVPLGGEAFSPGVEETFQAPDKKGFTDTHVGYPLQRIHSGAKPYEEVLEGSGYGTHLVTKFQDPSQEGAHLPALDAFHQMPDHEHGINRVHDRREVSPGQGRQGEQEWGRKGRIPDSYSEQEDYLNGPIGELLDDIRARTAAARREPGYDMEEHIAEMADVVRNARGDLSWAAALDYADKLATSGRGMQALARQFAQIFVERRQDEVIARMSRLIRTEEALR